MIFSFLIREFVPLKGHSLYTDEHYYIKAAQDIFSYDVTNLVKSVGWPFLMSFFVVFNSEVNLFNLFHFMIIIASLIPVVIFFITYLIIQV